MAEYTVAQAASLIGVSRQSVYKYLRRDRGRYVADPGASQTVITDQGLERLRQDIGSQAVGRQDNKDRIAELEREVIRLTAKVETLTVQHDADQRLIQVLQQHAENTQRALDQEQQLRLHELVKPSWIRRLLGKKEK